MTKHYQIGKRYEWAGGDCPVYSKALVRVWFNELPAIPYEHVFRAGFWDWFHTGIAGNDIIAFEVVKDGSFGE